MFKIDILNDIKQSVRFALLQNLYIVHQPMYFEERIKYEYTLWSIAKGNLYIKMNNNIYHAGQGDIVMFKPGMSYIFYSDELGCEFMFEQISLKIGEQLDLLHELDFSGIIRSEHMGAECAKFCRCFKDRCRGMSDLSLDAHAAVLSYTSKIITHIRLSHHEPFSEIPRAAYTGIYKAISHINWNFTKKISAKELALIADLSEKYFIRLFKETLGISPNQYRIQCCMRYAEFLLTHTDKSIGSIAAELGYADIYSFSKAFKKDYGLPPIMFRKEYTE